MDEILVKVMENWTRYVSDCYYASVILLLWIKCSILLVLLFPYSAEADFG